MLILSLFHQSDTSPPFAPLLQRWVCSSSGRPARPPHASSCSGKLRILRWACLRYCCCLKYTLNAPLMATKAMPPCDGREKKTVEIRFKDKTAQHKPFTNSRFKTDHTQHPSTIHLHLHSLMVAWTPVTRNWLCCRWDFLSSEPSRLFLAYLRISYLSERDVSDCAFKIWDAPHLWWFLLKISLQQLGTGVS